MKALLIISIMIFQVAESFGNDSLSRYLNNGDQAFKQQNFQQAIAQYDLALKFDSHSYEALYARGRAYVATKQLDLALSDFNSCILIRPENKYTYLERGRLKASIRDYDGALTDFEMCAKLDPLDYQVDLYMEYCKLNLHGF